MQIDIGDAALAAATAARERLGNASRTVDERGMAAVARQALFCEALLGAVRARVQELRTVAR